jgi:hypothetical protein
MSTLQKAELVLWILRSIKYVMIGIIIIQIVNIAIP